MSKQVLSIEQMLHLQELGFDTSNASASLYKPDMDTEYMLMFGHLKKEELVGNEEDIPSYTLQDVLDALPNRIYDKGAFYLGCYDIMIDEHDICYAKWCGSEIESTYVEIEIKDYLIDAAYELLVWCIENKFVETNKNE